MLDFIRQRTKPATTALALVIVVGFSLLFLGSFVAQAVVTGVTLADNDTTGFGLDGRDFRVTWTPGTEPAGYQFTQIFIVSSAVNLTTTTLVSACTGAPGNVCQPVGFFNQNSASDFTLPQFLSKDSNGASWSTSTSYVAYIYVSATVPSIVSSTAVAYTGAYDFVSDVTAPQVDHMSVHGAVASVNAPFYALVFDDQTTENDFTSTTDGGAESINLYYGANVGSSVAVTSATRIDGSLFQFTIPSASVPAAGGVLQYYIIARDRTGNSQYVCANPSANSTSSCQTSPYVLTTVAAGSRTIAGTISSNGNNLTDAYVFAGGFASLVTTSTNGAYTLGGLPNNDAVDVTAFKMGYCKNSRFETLGTANKTGVNLSINMGMCGFFSGGGGSGGGSPLVNFSGPPDGSNNVIPNEKIRVGLSQPMTASTINDNNAADVGSYVYLTTDDGTTKVPGSAFYCETNSSIGCSSLSAQDTNTILFIPASNLATSTFYTLVITEQVTSQGGQSIQGNRPGGGHKISFTVGGGALTGQFTLGASGQFMPPFVRSMVPAPGIVVAPNVKLALEFDQALNSATINTTNITLVDKTNNNATVSLSSVTLDSNEKRFISVTPASALVSGREYELRVTGAVGNPSGVTMRPPDQASTVAFSSFFKVSGSNDSVGPTVYPLIANNATGVAVNKNFDFGFSEQIDFNTINTTNVTFSRGSTAVTIKVSYDPGKNNLTVVPTGVLAPNTAYTLTLGSGVKDLAGNAIATSAYIYTTGAADTTVPAFSEARCDDYTCSISFNEPMNSGTQVDTTWVSSTLNHRNFTLTQSGADKVVTTTIISYDATRNAVIMQGLGLTKNTNFNVVIAGVTDLSGNTLPTQNFTGIVEDSAKTFGSFGDQSMFGPPTSNLTGGLIGGGQFQPQGFGTFTAEQFALGQADRAFPFNPTGGQDSNVFQVQFSPGVAILNGDKVQLTFPNGTGLSSAALDTLSPMNRDMNQQGVGTVTGTTIVADTTLNTVTVTLGVSGTPGTGDMYTLDLRKITNPSIPKDPTTGGYTVGIKVTRSGSVLVNKTSMPYFIKSAGANSITVRVYASSAGSPDNVAGTVSLFAGGPAGAMNKTLTLTTGAISAVDGVSTTSVAFTSLSDGCYFLGTDPSLTLSGVDYFGQMSPEPVCVTGGQSLNKNIVLTAASSGNGSITTTIKFAGIADFGGADIDIFAGGPGRYVVKTLTGVTTPNAGGYTIKLPANGQWFVGVGPSMPKGSSGGLPTSLPGVPPAPVQLLVSGVGTASSSLSLANSVATPGASFNNSSDTVTFTFATANKTITGKVTDGSIGIPNVTVFLHRQGFGSPVFSSTNASGTFSLAVSDYGSYEITASKDGLPSAQQQIEARSDDNIYYQGKQITGGNPLVLTLKKAAYTISGKVLDVSGNGVAYAAVFAVNGSTGQNVSARSSADGSYSIFVDTGSWNLRGELPPDKSDTCGTLTLVVAITTESKSSQNISPSANTCYTLSGTVSVGGAVLANAPLFVQEWNVSTGAPVAGGAQRGASTDSNGGYNAKVAGSKTYRIGTWHSDYGELSATKAVGSADAVQNVTVTTLATTTFSFTGGTAAMNAMVELKNASDSTKVVRKQKAGLDTSLQINTESGSTLKYFIDVLGVGKFTGTATAGTTTTIDLGLQSTNFITVTGTIKNDAGTVLPGAVVSFSDNSAGVMQTAVADISGNYSVSIKAGSYKVGSSLAGYVAGAAQTVSFATNTAAYDFGGTNADQSSLQTAGKTIEGVIRDAQGVLMTDGYVWAENTAGLIVSAAVNAADGTYVLPVTTGTWTLSATGPKAAPTSKVGTVAISTANSTGNNITLTADAARVPTSTSGIIAASAGGSVNDTGASGIKLTAGAGVLETGTSNITLDLEKNYTAPKTQSFSPLANASFQINATGDSAIKNLNGNAEIQISYADLLSQIPSGVAESELKLMYLSPETGDYMPVEGGFTVDAVNNTVTGLVSHFTDFVIAYVPAAVVITPTPNVPSGGGGSNSVSYPAVTSTVPVVVVIPTTTAIVVTPPTTAIVVTPVIALVTPVKSSTVILGVVPTILEEKALLQFKYSYKNSTKQTKMFKIVRELHSSSGKIVLTRSANIKIKANGIFNASVKEKLAAYKVGNYTTVIKVYSGKTLMDSNSFAVEIVKPQKKYLLLGEVEQTEGAMIFTKKTLTPYRAKSLALPSTVRLQYSYGNTTKATQKFTVTRELVNAAGKVLESKRGKWTVKPNKRDSQNFVQALPKSLAPGAYVISIKATDSKTGEVLSANKLHFEIVVR